MKRLYYENQYNKEFTAEIINVIEKENNYHVELDQTCFYPEGGGQLSDTGLINDSKVSFVYEEDGRIYHVLDKKPIKIHRVKCSIDFEKRMDHMQQHLGQHILSACIIEAFGANTIGFHMGSDYSSIDIDKYICSEELAKAEALANKIIADKIEVEILYPTYIELKKLSLRKAPPKTNEPIRIVKIGDIDASPCCGTHPSSTVEVQIIKIIKSEKYKVGTRIEFLCGNRAISDYIKKHNIVDKMANVMSCSNDALFSEVERLKTGLDKALSEQRALKAEIANYEVLNMLNSCENINNIRVLKGIYDNADVKHLNLLASKLVSYPNVIVLFGGIINDKAQLIFMRSRDLNIISMNLLLKDAITLIDGKGGGTDFSAQGGGKNNNNLESAIEYAYRKVKESIEKQ